MKLADFGYARIEDIAGMHTPCGSQIYNAPEVDMNRPCSYTKAVDMWSLGSMLYEMYVMLLLSLFVRLWQVLS